MARLSCERWLNGVPKCVGGVTVFRGHLRDLITFALGAAGFLHELFLTGTERPFVLTACLALMGFPFVLGVDSKIRGRNGDQEKLDEERWSHLP